MLKYSNITRSKSIDDVKYTKPSGAEITGVLKISFCSQATRPLGCENSLVPSIGYFSDFKTCLPLSNDNGLNGSTIWTYKSEGHSEETKELLLESRNPEGFELNTSVHFICDDNDLKVDATFDKTTRNFHITAHTKYSCRLPLSHITIVFNHYRYLIMIVAIATGIFVNYWGIQKIKRTVAVLGVVTTFFTSLFILSTLVFTGIFISVS